MHQYYGSGPAIVRLILADQWRDDAMWTFFSGCIGFATYLITSGHSQAFGVVAGLSVGCMLLACKS